MCCIVLYQYNEKRIEVEHSASFSRSQLCFCTTFSSRYEHTSTKYRTRIRRKLQYKMQHKTHDLFIVSIKSSFSTENVLQAMRM